MTDNNLLAILAELISFPTVGDDKEAMEKCFAYAGNYLAKNGLSSKRFNHAGAESLFASTHQQTQPRVLLQAHLDVVPGKPEAYQLTENNGRLYGRGVFDMKFAAACYLQLVADLKPDLQSYDFGIMLTSDEEVGGADGVGYLLERGYGATVCILPDGGNNWEMETSCNGVWWLRLSADGQAAHGSRPWEGQNAINRLMEACQAISAIFGELNDSRDSLTIGQFNGGTAINQVPDRAAVGLDMRFRSQESYAAKRPQIEVIIDKYQLKAESELFANPTITDVDNPHVAQFVSICEQQRGIKLGQCHSLGSSDARYFAERDIPTIIIRPTGGGAHADDEWLDKAEFLKFYEILLSYVQATAKLA